MKFKVFLFFARLCSSTKSQKVRGFASLKNSNFSYDSQLIVKRDLHSTATHSDDRGQSVEPKPNLLVT